MRMRMRYERRMQKRLVLGCLTRRAYLPLVRELTTACVPCLALPRAELA